MDTKEMLNAINKLLVDGYKVSDAEKELGFGDGYVRKRLSKEGYRFDRKLNQYIAKDKVVTGSNGMLQKQEQPLQRKPEVTCSNGVMPRQDNKNEGTFSSGDIDILHKIISEYKIRQQIQSVAEEDKGKTINRNVRVYEKQFEVFADWCKTNNVTQADALYKAISLLMDNKK